ncbi:MAG TPA: MFS transporter [Steroidobacteraceae bacterium]|jgi:MFS family permease|nr:MFS transporter [Steroidobacteraceae bacterium]
MRWWVLALAAIAVSSSYYNDDVIGPIADLLHRQRGFSQSQLGMLNGVISIPNAALALINGLLIDRYGPARIAFWCAAIGVLGAALTAVGEPYSLMVAGRFIFGISEGSIFIALLAGLAQWFSRGGIALAAAIYLSLARVGSYAVDTSTAWAHPLYERGWQPPLWLGSGVALAGFAAAAVFYWLDRHHRPELHPAVSAPNLHWRDLLKFDLSYWYILALHVLYAAVFFPFRTTYVIEYFQHAKGLTLQQAGVANSWVFFSAIFATPFFGLLADRFGHRALMLCFGTLLLPLTFVVLGTTSLSLWVSTAMMGISFSLVPAVIWPATTLIVAPRRLGTALGLITLIQALGMAASNLAAGWLADKAGAGAENPGGYDVMLWFFFLLSLTALSSAVLLWRRETGPDGHGLEVTNGAALQARHA